MLSKFHDFSGLPTKVMKVSKGRKFIAVESLLRRTHHKVYTLYKADKDFAPNFLFSGQTLLKVISIKRTLP